MTSRYVDFLFGAKIYLKSFFILILGQAIQTLILKCEDKNSNGFHKASHLPQNWAYWPIRQCCLAGSSKTTFRSLIFSIAMDAEYLSYVKFVATFAVTFYGYIISILASEYSLIPSRTMKI